MRRGMRGLGQPSTPVPIAPGGFCPTLPTPCPSGTVLSIDANNCPNYPCTSTATTATTITDPFSFLSNTDPFLGLPYWVWIVAGGAALYAMKK